MNHKEQSVDVVLIRDSNLQTWGHRIRGGDESTGLWQIMACLTPPNLRLGFFPNLKVWAFLFLNFLSLLLLLRVK